MSGNPHGKLWLAAAALALLASAAGGQPQDEDLSGAPVAEEALPEAETAAANSNPEREAPQTQMPEEAGPQRQAPASSPELFLPTEEISEDFAVPFPSDI